MHFLRGSNAGNRLMLFIGSKEIFPSYVVWTWSIHSIARVQFSSVQSLSCVWLFATPWIAARHASLSITNSWSSLKLNVHRVSEAIQHLILCHPLVLLPPIPPSIRVFSNKSALHMRWPKYWSFSFSIIPSKEHPELISFGDNKIYVVTSAMKQFIKEKLDK